MLYLHQLQSLQMWELVFCALSAVLVVKVVVVSLFLVLLCSIFRCVTVFSSIGASSAIILRAAKNAIRESLAAKIERNKRIDAKELTQEEK